MFENKYLQTAKNIITYKKGANIMYEIPKTLGACADILFELRNKRLELQKSVDRLVEEESALKSHIIANLPNEDASGISGKVARVGVVTKKIPQVTDWIVFYDYVKNTGYFDLIQRRLSDSSVKERWVDGVDIPGVGSFELKTVSINKL